MAGWKVWEANETAIEVDWSRTLVNGVDASYGIGGVELTGLNQYGFIINGWA